jgi:hypothetical protein
MRDPVPFRTPYEAAPDHMLWGTDWLHPKLGQEHTPDNGDLLDLRLDGFRARIAVQEF